MNRINEKQLASGLLQYIRYNKNRMMLSILFLSKWEANEKV
jgi:hypothetical protein